MIGTDVHGDLLLVHQEVTMSFVQNSRQHGPLVVAVVRIVDSPHRIAIHQVDTENLFDGMLAEKCEKQPVLLYVGLQHTAFNSLFQN